MVTWFYTFHRLPIQPFPFFLMFKASSGNGSRPANLVFAHYFTNPPVCNSCLLPAKTLSRLSPELYLCILTLSRVFVQRDSVWPWFTCFPVPSVMASVFSLYFPFCLVPSFCIILLRLVSNAQNRFLFLFGFSVLIVHKNSNECWRIFQSAGMVQF